MTDFFKQSNFVQSVYKLSELKLQTLPEVILAGRSNAGKSTLINALTCRKNLAKVSQTPGKTQAVNYFLVKDGELAFYLTDLPGYGYSASGRKKQAAFSALTDNYLESGRDFALILLLLDIRHIPGAQDRAMLEWLFHKNLPFAVIFNKADKLSKAQQQKAVKEAQAYLPENCPYFTVSAAKSEGLNDLLATIREVVTNYQERSGDLAITS